jgi:hypothetical protein
MTFNATSDNANRERTESDLIYMNLGTPKKVRGEIEIITAAAGAAAVPF